VLVNYRLPIASRFSFFSEVREFLYAPTEEDARRLSEVKLKLSCGFEQKLRNGDFLTGKISKTINNIFHAPYFIWPITPEIEVRIPPTKKETFRANAVPVPDPDVSGGVRILSSICDASV
jgi:hypothetical protein